MSLLHTSSGESKNTLVTIGLCFMCWNLFQRYQESELHVENSGQRRTGPSPVKDGLDWGCLVIEQNIAVPLEGTILNSNICEKNKNYLWCIIVEGRIRARRQKFKKMIDQTFVSKLEQKIVSISTLNSSVDQMSTWVNIFLKFVLQLAMIVKLLILIDLFLLNKMKCLLHAFSFSLNSKYPLTLSHTFSLSRVP